ncbi:hypothetical protein LO763_01485 [Glycomyces sp. A-F 0318]|uniref:hypothetical protein n=1 Tax=Glycomyces amatae TaxID=2881355 RepID=UPI001E615214|nr:hypothetical protein [Glycomyces amatae]MCD0442297.1 hypothetical protein [Glycomyces amatae]
MPGFPPPPRKRGKGLAITLTAVGVVAVLGAVLVGLYGAGMIGPTRDEEAAEAAPPEHRFDEELCDKVDFAAFGPELSQDGPVEVSAEPIADGMGVKLLDQIDCWMYYGHMDGGSMNGQLSITMQYNTTEERAAEAYSPGMLAPEVQDLAEPYESSWDEGLIGQYRWEGEADAVTHAIFRDGNVVGAVRFAWSGGVWDTDRMMTGVQDIAEQLMVQLDR